MGAQRKTVGSCLLLLLIANILWSTESGVGASYSPNSVLEIQLGDLLIEQFKYIPTLGGYEYGYTLPNGTHRDELGELLNANSTPEEIRNANNYARNARPSRRPGVKNRKLSPKSLSSLAG
ncbi:uncharacterized protein LOC108651667 [Drosophila navojoa]|nr:uncharacterized protein LOC108651667 [Drosophila navojoa]XP_030246870.1 uncharacterized protein LOC108651667 [Drosophila navojoa]